MASLIYNLFLLLYKSGVALTSPWNPKARLWIEGRKDIFDRLQTAVKHSRGQQVIWMHCASLGEFEQGRPVLESLKKKHGSAVTLITFFSPSGYEAAKHYAGADHIFYLPIDSAHHAEKFLDIVQPTLILWIKYEYWYYYLSAIKKKNIPLLLISAIFSKEQIFFRWYGGFYRKMLHCFSHIFVQTEASKMLLEEAGFTGHATVSGDTRFDRVIDIASRFEAISVVEQFCGNRQVIVAGSTWKEDEEVLDHFANTHPDHRFIIAPHEINPQHLREVKKLFARSVFYSELKQRDTGITAGTQAPNVLIIDNIGMLSRLYHYATVAYVGGGFGSAGVHNVLEAAVYGKPVVIGPVYAQFAEAEELVASGGAFSIGSALALETIFNRLLQNTQAHASASQSAASYVLLKQGATSRITDFITTYQLIGNGG